MNTFKKLSDLTKRLESLKKLSSSLTTKYKNDEIDIDTYQNDLESFKSEINVCKLEIISLVTSM
jgi:peptidoglycan hydrolase CwlO-like protein